MTTPARRQYLDIKAQHADTLLAYQVGDFFEFFDEDARIAARVLQIVLTSRSYGPDEQVPLAGVPLHALDTYLARLVARGYRVAVCEQVSPPGKGLVKREVTRILTPGTVVEPGMLSPSRDNYLVAVAFQRRTTSRGERRVSAGLAYVDASSGAFACTTWPHDALPDGLQAELHRLAPAEVLVPQGITRPDAEEPSEEQSWIAPFPLSPCPGDYFDVENARLRLQRHFQTPTLAAFGCESAPLAIATAGAILTYLERMNPSLLTLVTSLTTYSTSGFVEIDGRTLRALEVVEPAHAASAPAWSNVVRHGTLLSTLDTTRTPMGARTLRRQLTQPLRNREAIEARLDAVAELYERPGLREVLTMLLDGLGDLERLMGRIAQGTATPRELHGLRLGLDQVPKITRALRSSETPALSRLRDSLDACPDVSALIERAIPEPGSTSGRMLRTGYSRELDDCVEAIRGAREWIAALEPTERERTGIKSLKVGYNKVFGYYIEVSKTHLSKVPDDYQRRQTLANGERYVTAELKDHEARVLTAEDEISALERSLYNALLGELTTYQGLVRATSAALAQLDVWLSLATVAIARGYVRPELSADPLLEIDAGRHAIVETALDGDEFMPNDTSLDASTESEGTPRIALLTGPNMAGKSTYLRQVATITLLAHVGSFVPARSAHIGLVDRIFARVGAEDDLARGLSTFMLEMVETAHILRHATAHSLIILDEVGRGTSTSDGLAIARAVVEYLHDTVRARILFATHYHELATLERELPGLRAYRMEVAERSGRAIFLHRVVPGPSRSSYGVQVAAMAGLPPAVTERARVLLDGQLAPPEQSYIAEQSRAYEVPDEGAAPVVRRPTDTSPSEHVPPGQIVPAEHSQTEADVRLRTVLLELASVQTAAITPIEAINLLFMLQQRALDALHTPQTR